MQTLALKWLNQLFDRFVPGLSGDQFEVHPCAVDRVDKTADV